MRRSFLFIFFFLIMKTAEAVIVASSEPGNRPDTRRIVEIHARHTIDMILSNIHGGMEEQTAISTALTRYPKPLSDESKEELLEACVHRNAPEVRSIIEQIRSTIQSSS